MGKLDNNRYSTKDDCFKRVRSFSYPHDDLLVIRDGNGSDSDRILKNPNLHPIIFGSDFPIPIQIRSGGSKENLRIRSNSDRIGVGFNPNSK